MTIVAGADARHGRNPGLLITRVRTQDGIELAAQAYFTTMVGYLTTSQP